MRNKLISLIILIGLTFAIPGSAMADTEVTSSNSSTGADSTNTTSSTVTNDNSVVNNNTSVVTNTIDITGSTGANSASANTGDGTVGSGSIDGNVEVSSTDNQNTTLLTDSGSINITQQNTETGSNSTNSSSINVSNINTVTNTNDSVKENNLIVDLSTGGNIADGNSGGSSITSGDITFNVGVTNVDNINETNIGPPAPGGVSQPPEGQGGQQPPPQVGGGGAAIAQALGGPTEVTSAQPAGEILGISSLPITGPTINLWILALLAASVALLGWFMINRSYAWEKALIRKRLSFSIKTPPRRRG
ncbi:MAG: hypothetical protein HYW45_03925 [Candidatus Daviesbacteria bacterium]|nr:MAG: hypothetical protein HYW45_03925 [Candidatus Daviesbacteria bacterium]